MFQVEDGRIFFPAEQDGFVAYGDRERVGIVTYVVEDDVCRIGLLESLLEHVGIGRGLVDAVVAEAGARGCSSVRVTTTNDNQRAQRFYEMQGFEVGEIREGAVTETRRTLKPTISSTGEDGVPITDEIEYELRIGPRD